MAIIPKAVESFRSSGVAASGYNPSVTEGSGKAAGLNQIAAGMGQLAQIVQKSAEMDGHNNAMDMVLNKTMEFGVMEQDVAQRVARKEITSQKQIADEWKTFEDKWEKAAVTNDENLGTYGQQVFRDQNRALKLSGSTWAAVTGLEVTRNSERAIVKKANLIRVKEVSSSNTPVDAARRAWADYETDSIKRQKITTLPENEILLNHTKLSESFQNTYVESLFIKGDHDRLMFEADINYERLEKLATEDGAEIVTIRNNETGNDDRFINMEGTLVGMPPRKELIDTPQQKFMTDFPPEKQTAVARKLLIEMKKASENNVREIRARVTNAVTGNLTGKRTNPAAIRELIKQEEMLKPAEKSSMMAKLYASNRVGKILESMGNMSKGALMTSGDVVNNSTTTERIKQSLLADFGDDPLVISALKDPSFLASTAMEYTNIYNKKVRDILAAREHDFLVDRIQNSGQVAGAYEKFKRQPTEQNAGNFKYLVDSEKERLQHTGKVDYVPVEVMKNDLLGIKKAMGEGGVALGQAIAEFDAQTRGTDLETYVWEQAVGAGMPFSLYVSNQLGLDPMAAGKVYKGLALINNKGLEASGISVEKLNAKIQKDHTFQRILKHTRVFGYNQVEDVVIGALEVIQSIASEKLVNAKEDDYKDAAKHGVKTLGNYLAITDHGVVAKNNLSKLVTNGDKATGLQELNMRASYLNKAIRTGKLQLLPTASDIAFAKLNNVPVQELLNNRRRDARTVIGIDGSVKIIDITGAPITLNAGLEYAPVPAASFTPEWFKGTTEGLFNTSIGSAIRSDVIKKEAIIADQLDIGGLGK